MGREPRAAGSRVALAIVGALIVVSISAGMAIGPALHLGFPGFTSAGAAQPTATSPDTAQDQPTDTPTSSDPSATRTPRPTATARPCVVGTGDLHGTITSVNTAQNSFALRVCGASKTILVNANTKYQGAATSLASLKPGWLAEVACVLQSGSTYLASDVNAQVDNN